MDILAHCRIYPISRYIDIPKHKEPATQGGFVHIILDEIKNKSYQWIHQRQGTLSDGSCLSNGMGRKLTLVIDLLNVWDLDNSTKNNERGTDTLQRGGSKHYVHVIKGSKYISFQELIDFLNDELLVGKYLFKNFENMVLYGIIIDNLSIYTFDLKNAKLFNKIFKVLAKIRCKYGCWIKTVSFKDSIGNGKYSTRVPIYYLNNMETIIVYENDKSVKIK